MNKKFYEVLFSTKNNDKILKEFNKLSIEVKKQVLFNEKCQKRLCKIANAELLVSLLIDLPYEIRTKFLNNLDKELLTDDLKKVIIELLKLQNYDDFDYKKLLIFEKENDKIFLSLIFRKVSVDKLKKLLVENICPIFNDYIFVEYSKKMPSIVLEPSLIENINDNVLIVELKRRLKQKNITLMSVDYFMQLDIKKQNSLLLNGSIVPVEEKLVQMYQAKYLNVDDNEKMNIFSTLLNNLNYFKLLELQIIINSVSDEKAKEMMKLFFGEVGKFDCEVVEKYLNAMIFNFRKLNDKTRDIYKVMKLHPYSIIYYLNTGMIDEEVSKFFNKKITVDQYQKTNGRKINKIKRLLEGMPITESIKKVNLTILSYKIYYVFGYEIAMDLLNQKYGPVDLELLVRLFKECDIKNVKFQNNNGNYEPEINLDFVRFLIGDRKDNNTTLKRMLRGELDILIVNFSNLFNYFIRFQQSIGKKIHLNKLIPLFKENTFILLPNEYKLDKFIIDNVIKSYKYQTVNQHLNANYCPSDKEMINNACNFFHNYLEKRVVSAIPRVYGITEDNYKYEVLRLDDPTIMILGYLTGCCFRLNGQSCDFLNYCSESLYARVIVIRNENNEICSMIPVIRNGNVIAGNSVESNEGNNPLKIYNALKCAFNDIINISCQYEEDHLILGCVTNLHNNVEGYSKTPLSKNIYPIRRSHFYTNYNSQQYIVSILPGKSVDDINEYVPDAIYYDERPDILDYNGTLDSMQYNNEVKKRVNSINYQLGIDNYKLFWATYYICSEDWYLKVDFRGVDGYCLDKDPRALEEFNSVKKRLEEYINNKDTDGPISINDLLSNKDYNSAKYQQLVLKKKIDK